MVEKIKNRSRIFRSRGRNNDRGNLFQRGSEQTLWTYLKWSWAFEEARMRDPSEDLEKIATSRRCE